jgi:hypothetical protein
MPRVDSTRRATLLDVAPHRGHGGGLCRGQEPESRPSAGPAPEVTTQEWTEWTEGLASRDSVNPFMLAAHESLRASFAAARIIDCGARAWTTKTDEPAVLQRVIYAVAGFDPSQTFVEVPNAKPPVRVVYGQGLGVRGLESLDVAARGEMCVGDAKTQAAKGTDVEVQEQLKNEFRRALGNPFRDESSFAVKGGVVTADVWSPWNGVMFAAVRNNAESPATVPAFVSSLKARGAKAVLLVDDLGAQLTSGPVSSSRRDLFQGPPLELPSALFITIEAAKALGVASGVPIARLLDSAGEAARVTTTTRSRLRVSVRYRVDDVDVPNVVARVGSQTSEYVLLSASGGGNGHAVAQLLAATKLLARTQSARRSVVVAIVSGADLEMGGQAWLLENAPVPLGQIVAAIHLSSKTPREGEDVPGLLEVVKAARASPDLQSAVVDAFERNGLPLNEATNDGEVRRAVDAYAARGIPAIGLLLTAGSFDDGLAAARTAAAVTRDFAEREGRPALPAN